MLHLEVHGDFMFQLAGGKTMKFEEIFYELIRCALIHEGDMDSRVRIIQSQSIGLDDQGNFLLSEYIIMALCLVLVSDPNTVQIKWPDLASFTIDGQTIKFSDIQGDPNKLADIFRTISKERSSK
jgi:hypothetical protein